jgi:hypothetical protein
MDLNFIWINLKKNGKSTISPGLTAVHGHSGPLGQGPRWWPLAAHATWFTARAHSLCGHSVVRDQCMWHGAVLNGPAIAYRRCGLHLDLLHWSLYEPWQQDLNEVAGRGVLAGDVIRSAAANDVEGGNNFKVREGAPSSAPELHMSDMDIRPCLTGDEKWRSESSPVAVDVTRVIHSGGWGSGLMIPKPRAKIAQGSEDHLCKMNSPMARPIDG